MDWVCTCMEDGLNANVWELIYSAQNREVLVPGVVEQASSDRLWRHRARGSKLHKALASTIGRVPRISEPVPRKLRFCNSYILSILALEAVPLPGCKVMASFKQSGICSGFGCFR